jgi:hypothetical protein
VQIGSQYYDPSYGVTYPSAAGFETHAVQGYATQIGSDSGGSYHFRFPTPGAPNITLSPPIPGSSM